MSIIKHKFRDDIHGEIIDDNPQAITIKLTRNASGFYDINLKRVRTMKAGEVVTLKRCFVTEIVEEGKSLPKLMSDPDKKRLDEAINNFGGFRKALIPKEEEKDAK